MQPVEITTMNKLSNNLDLHNLYVGHQISMQPYEYTLLVITHVTTHKLLQVCKKKISLQISLHADRQQVVFALLVPSCRNKFTTSR